MRDTIFISHANPEDNQFTIWLALQLAREGYPVWCDLINLSGGDDLWNTAEGIIRERAIKVVYVLSKVSNTKDGPLKELQIATNVSRQNNIANFIIPVWIDNKLSSHEFNILIARMWAISFKDGWAEGLEQLIKGLKEDHVSIKETITASTVREWWKTKFSIESGVKNNKEECFSNWFIDLFIFKGTNL